MTQPHKSGRTPGKDKPIGDSKAGGETPRQRFVDSSFPPDYEQKGDVDCPPFEGHSDHDANSGRPCRQSPGPEASGQHGQRPKKSRIQPDAK